MLLDQATELIEKILIEKKLYKNFFLVGYSIGGFLTTLILKHLEQFHSNIKAAMLIAPLIDYPVPLLPKLKIEAAMQFHQTGKTEFVDEESGFTIVLTKEAFISAKKMSIYGGEKFELPCQVWTVWGNRDKICPPNGVAQLKSKLKGDTLETDFHFSVLPMCGHKMDRMTDETIVGMHYDDMMKVVDDL